MNLDLATRMAGHKLVAGFPGTSLPDSLIELVKQHKVSNFILFRHNIENSQQLTHLCQELQTLTQQETGTRALITIDQEGGGVSRLPYDCPVFPSQMAIAATQNPQNAYDAARFSGRQLAGLGVNFNLAPVMDLNLNPNNPVIGTRSYSDRPQLAARFGKEAIRGYQESGVFAAAKHFPGHGDTAVDSHVGLPTVDKSMEEMWQTELSSFASAIDAGVPAIMVSHILYPKLQKNPLPATMSRDIITGLLKQEMHFNGLAISDCMMMDAIAKHYGTVEGCIASAKAGMDLIFVSHDPVLAAKAALAIRDSILGGEIDEAEAQASLDKVLAAKLALDRAPAASVNESEAPLLRSLCAKMAEEAICLTQAATLPAIGSSPLFIGRPPLRASHASDPSATPLSFASMLAKATGGLAYEPGVQDFSDEIPTILSAAQHASCAVLGVQTVRLSPQEEQLLIALSGLNIPLICVALRTPYPLSALPEGVIGMAAFDYNEDSLAALCKVFTGQLVPSGELPCGCKERDMSYVAGWDGGGSKTSVVCLDLSGNQLIEQQFGPLNPNGAAPGAVETSIRSALEAMALECGSLETCRHLVVGAAGVSNPKVTDFLREQIRQCGYVGPLTIVGDHEILLHGAVGQIGTVLIAGTGSICLGRNALGKTQRAGGLGYLIGDEGSGYWIGLQVLRAVTRMLDKRGPDTLLAPALLEALQCDKLGDLVAKVYGGGLDKAAIATLARLMVDPVQKNDAVALDIARAASNELCSLAECIIQGLALSSESLALCGGLLSESSPLRAMVKEQLNLRFPRLQILSPKKNAAQGAAQLALQHVTA